ncbi:MAG: hypothetical protein ACTS4T_01810 [Candidatus Hodgkinia cicadicola]
MAEPQSKVAKARRSRSKGACERPTSEAKVDVIAKPASAGEANVNRSFRVIPVSLTSSAEAAPSPVAKQALNLPPKPPTQQLSI